MFKRRTLFIVGAGASKEVDFPIGADLAQKISDNLRPHSDDFGGVSNFNDDMLFDELRRKLASQNNRNMNPYINAARRIHEGIEGTNSVDDFLNVHQQDPLIVEVGKAAIVRAILDAEKRCDLHVDQSNTYNKMNVRQVGATWFMKLMRVLAPDTTPQTAATAFSNVAFIVFNYDRCVEHFLEHIICAVYGLNRQDAAAIVKGITIIHPYGKIGELDTLPFGGIPNPVHAVLPLASQIKTYAEQFEDRKQLEQIHEEMTKADCIVFLGFSYLEQNMALLTPPDRIPAKPIFGTAFGLSDHDCDLVADQLLSMLNSRHIGLPKGRKLIELKTDLKCAGLFDFYARSLNAPPIS